MSSFRRTAVEAAKKAGDFLDRNFGKVSKTIKKENNSYVTDLDLKAENIIISLIRRNFPEHNVLSEEAGKIGGNSEYTWIIDPLDGTHNYMVGIPLYGVSIALMKADKIMLGVVYMPYLDELYIAERGKGALLNGKRLKTQKKEPGKQVMIYDSLLREDSDKKARLLGKLAKKVFRVRMFGAAVYEGAQVAKGVADIFVSHSTHIWDIAAIFLIIEEAGGHITDFNGNNWTSEINSFVACSSRELNKKIVDVIRI